MTDLKSILASYREGASLVDAAVADLAALVQAQSAPGPDPTPTPTPGKIPYLDKAAWLWGKIPAGAKKDPKSAAVIGELQQGQTKLTFDSYGVTVYKAKITDPRVAVAFTNNWGSNPHGGAKMPVPVGPGLAVPPGGWGAQDGHVVVIDEQQGLVFSEWMASNGGRSAAWGSAVPLRGDGIEPAPMTSTGSALCRLAGVITEAEMAGGYIPHALFMSCKLVGAGFRYPARKTDQSGNEATQEGMRLQLDPSFDVRTLKSRAAQIIAKAMQDYGIYCGDGGGSGATIIGERTGPGVTKGWGSVGASDMMLLDIPWSRCWVLDESVTRP